MKSGSDPEKGRNRFEAPRKPLEKAAPLKGLCLTCARKKTCLHPKPEGGVWHCEEYEECR